MSKQTKDNDMKTNLFLIAFTTLFLANDAAQAQSAGAKKTLIAYYSYGGNTRTVAQQIARATGGDLFEIVPAAAYPTDYDTVVEQAKREIEAGARPALKNALPDIGAYDVVFVGSPCWWATVAPPVTTFLAGLNLSGKTVVPFMTHEGSRMGRTVADIRKLCPRATVTEGLPVRGGSVNRSEEEVRAWLRGMKLMR